MPLKLIQPKPGRTPNYTIRGTHLGYRVERSTKTGDRALARKALKKIERQIECGEFADASRPTFAGAAVRYMNTGGERRFMTPILERIGRMPLDRITQDVIDEAAAFICPERQAATRNREVYTPISAVLRSAGISITVRRPRGAQGSRRETWLRPEEAEKLLAAAWDPHPRFGALCSFLLYTGCRLSEGLELTTADLDLDRSFCRLPITKNGKPRGVHLPPVAVAAIRRALMEHGQGYNTKPRTEPRDGKVFCLTKSGHLYGLLNAAEKASGVTIPAGVSFHVFRHTYGAWMRRFGGVRLEETGAWDSRGGAAPYDHYSVSAAARAADLLPGASDGAAPGLKTVGEKK